MKLRKSSLALLTLAFISLWIIGCSGNSKKTIGVSGSFPTTGTVNVAYGPATLTASNGTGTFTWTVSGLPTGVTVQGALNTPTLTIGGTPTAAGTFMTTATVTDTRSNTATAVFTIVISNPSFTVTTTSLPSGTVGVVYSGPLAASGGTAPLTWAETSGGALPAGLTLTSATGVIGGTPTAAGSFGPYVFTVTDANNDTATSQNLSITIAAASQPTVTTTKLPGGTVGTAYTTTLAESGGTTPFTWAETSGGPLPAGLALAAGTGVIAGTPTAAGTFGPYVFTVTDKNGLTAASPSMTIFVVTAVAACAPVPAPRGDETALTQPFTFTLRGAESDDTPAAWAGSFTPNGKGGITNADADFMSTDQAHESLQVQLAGSSYSFGSDGRGCLYLTFSGENPAEVPGLLIARNASLRHGNAVKKVNARPAGVPANVGTVTFSFSLSKSSQVGSIQEFDYVTSSIVAAGQMHQQTPNDFNLKSLAQNFAFGADGWVTVDAQGDTSRVGLAGSVTNTAGALTNIFADANVGGTASGELTGGTGTLGAVSTTTGRGVGSYTIPDGASMLTFNFVYYVVNVGDFVFMSTDDPTTVNAMQLTGRALQSKTTAQSLNGFYLAALSGLDLSKGPANVGANSVEIATLQATSGGSIPTATIYSNDAGQFTTQTFTDGSYTVEAASGRVAITDLGKTSAPVAYLVATKSQDDLIAFLVGTDENSSSGFLALQGAGAPDLSDGSVSGSYAFGTTEDVAGVNGSSTGVFTFDGKGNYTNVLDVVTVNEKTNQPSTPGSGVLAVNADGSGTLDGGAQSFVTSGGVILAIDGATSSNGVQPLLYTFYKH